jgi:hypothetical protein
MHIAENSAADHVEIPTDGASDCEIDVKLLKLDINQMQTKCI